MTAEDNVLLIVFLNDNHVSNVRTLQSIYGQSYRNMDIVFCNDATNHFDSEKFVNNLRQGRPDGVQSVQLKENVHSVGEYRSFTDILKSRNPQYIMVLHSGEILKHKNVIEETIQECGDMQHVGAFAVCSTEMDDFMEKEESVTDLCVVAEEDRLWWKDETVWNGLRDCMFVYCGDVVRMMLKQKVQVKKSIMQTVVPLMIKNGYRIENLDMALCMYSKKSTENIVFPVAEVFGNNRLQTIRENYLNREGPTNPESMVDVVLSKDQIRYKRKKKINQIIFKLSRFKKLAVYVFATLLMAICAILLYSQRGIPDYLYIVISILSICMAGFTILMLVYNLIFKLHPERLISYD